MDCDVTTVDGLLGTIVVDNLLYSIGIHRPILYAEGIRLAIHDGDHEVVFTFAVVFTTYHFSC